MDIKYIRTLAGMTQQAFADYFGIPKTDLEKWESGKNKCKKYMLDLIIYKLKNEGIMPSNLNYEELESGMLKGFYVLDFYWSKAERKQVLKIIDSVLNNNEGAQNNAD